MKSRESGTYHSVCPETFGSTYLVLFLLFILLVIILIAHMFGGIFSQLIIMEGWIRFRIIFLTILLLVL